MAIHKITTNSRDEWLALRHKYIGGSDAASVVGLNPFQSAYSLWAEKTDKVKPFEGNLATEVGTYLEDFVARKFAKDTGKKVRNINQSIVNDEYPWAIANIDRDVVGEDAGLEIKTTSSLNLKRFGEDEYPENYYVQCMHYMAVTGYSRWYLAVLIGNNDFRIFEIKRDENEIASLMTAEKHFWDLVQSNTKPEIDGESSTTETIKALYPESIRDTRVDLFGFDNQLRMYQQLGEQIKNLEKQRDACLNPIKDYMGTTEKGESTMYKVSWVSSERRSFDSKKFAADHAYMDLSQYYKSSPSRIFRVTQKKI